MPDPDDALISLSALQHYLFCPRQCALIHVEQIWAEDTATAEGRVLHERVDAGGGETRPGVRVERGVALRSAVLGVSGRADAVEFHGRPPRPFPVEYKRGRPKLHRADEVQLCAQAICLEEMSGHTLPEGALFYGATRRRVTVSFDPPLRALTASVAAAARAMIASAVRRLLNTIYVTSDGAWLRKDGQNLVVEIEGIERGRAPLHLLDGVVSFGRAGASPSLMAACAEAGITLSLLDPNGRFLARVEGPRTGNVLLRRTQYRAADDPARHVPVVRAIVAAKSANQRAVVRRALRDHGDSMDAGPRETLVQLERKLTDVSRRTLVTHDVAALRGLEGEAAQAYFAGFDYLVRAEGEAFRFKGRSRRPPLDRINALLSFLYAMLGHDCRSALETHGLDPQVGFLHADRPGRASLALDFDGGAAAGIGRSVGAEPCEPPPTRAGGFRGGSAGRRTPDGCGPADGADRVAGPQARGAAASVPERGDAARDGRVGAGAVAGPASARRLGRLSGILLEVSSSRAC